MECPFTVPLNFWFWFWFWAGPSSLSRMAELDFEVRQRGQQQAALQRGKEDKERWSTDQKKYIYVVDVLHIRS